MASSTRSKPVSRSTRLQRIAVKQERDRRACGADSARFIERHCSIEETDGTVIPFTLWDFQREPLTALQDGESVIVLKARRLGLSWVVLAYALWRAIFQQGIRILILCKTEGDASESLDRIRRMLERIQNDPASAHILTGLQRPAKERDAVTKLDVGGSTIRALVGTPAAARSETAGLVIADEFAFQRKAPEIWRALLPTIDGGGQIAVVSTGNGTSKSGGDGAEFASQWDRARSGLSGFIAFFFPWMAHPARDEAWKARALAAQGDLERFRVEYPETEDDAFLSPESTFVFPGSQLAAVFRQGAQHAAQLAEGRLRPPVGSSLVIAADWGVHSHVLILWPLEGGGLFVPYEVVYEGDSVWDAASPVATLVRHLGHPVHEERFDASMPGLNAAFLRELRPLLPDKIKYLAVPFNKFKAVSYDYLRLLARNTADGKLPHLSISEQGCPVLADQLRGLEYADADAGRIDKGNDHGPDALCAGAAPIAAKR